MIWAQAAVVAMLAVTCCGAWLRHAARDATEAANEPTLAVALPSIAETQPPIAQPVETVATKTPVREDTRAVVRRRRRRQSNQLHRSHLRQLRRAEWPLAPRRLQSHRP